MNVILLPFFSQQDKLVGKFRLDSDSGVRLYAYIANRMRTDLKWNATLMLPPENQCVGLPPPSIRHRRIPYDLCLDNRDRRLQWEPGFLKTIGREADLVLTQHEFLPYPLRCLCSKLKIVVECGIRPDTAYTETKRMFGLSYAAADAVHFNSNVLSHEWKCVNRSFVWRFAYHNSDTQGRGLERDVDVLFNSRASATNYTNHEVFLKAFAASSLNVVMTDPTNYHKKMRTHLNRPEYIELLHRSKVVVGLTDNGYGGWAVVEAAACGAVPVVLDRPAYREVFGSAWPYYCELDTVREVVESALKGPSWVPNVDAWSYFEAWKVAKRDLLELVK